MIEILSSLKQLTKVKLAECVCSYNMFISRQISVYCSVLLLFQVARCFGSYSISANESKWTEAPSHCQIATPDLQIDKKRYFVKLQDSLHLDEDRVWIGYYRTTMIFEYIGCIELEDIPESNRSYIEIDKNPSQCYPSCETSVAIGVTAHKCYCIDSHPNSWNKNISRTGCKEECKTIACGGKDHVSLYQSTFKDDNVSLALEKSNAVSANEDETCLIIDRNSRAMEWNKCSEKFATICRTGNGTIVNAPTPGDNTWLKAAQACFEEGKYPVIYSDIPTTPGPEGPSVWTGVFKMDVVCRQDSYLSRSHPEYLVNLKYGSIKESNHNKYPLTFTTDRELKILCHEEAITTSSFKDSTLPSNEEFKNSLKPTYPNSDINEATRSDVTIGVSITLTLVVISGVISALIIRNRCKYSHKPAEANESGPGQDCNEYNYPDFSYNVEADRNTPDDTEYNYPDFSYNVEADRNTPDDTEYNYPDFSLESGVTMIHNASDYNTATNICPTDSSYNKISVRDQVGVEKRKCGRLTAEDRHLESAYNVLGNENAYNVFCTRSDIKAGKSYDRIVRLDNDTYNTSK